jgi:hypothetical protein
MPQETCDWFPALQSPGDSSVCRLALAFWHRKSLGRTRITHWPETNMSQEILEEMIGTHAGEQVRARVAGDEKGGLHVAVSKYASRLRSGACREDDGPAP